MRGLQHRSPQTRVLVLFCFEEPCPSSASDLLTVKCNCHCHSTVAHTHVVLTFWSLQPRLNSYRLLCD